MAALSLHHAIFTQEKDSDLPLRSATFLHPAPERDWSATSQLFASAAYQDLIQRQPTHPDGPRSGWDLGLNLLGDPMTTAERKSLRDRCTKARIRRLHAINVVFELVFGVWGTYTTTRYFLASAGALGNTKGICALVLGVVSALSVALVIISILMPLFPHQNRPHVLWYTRSLFRACYLLLPCAGAVMNFVLVLIWHPARLCSWDIDISWYLLSTNTSSAPCHTTSFAAWTAAAALRLAVTLTLALSFIYTLRAYHITRHPNSTEIDPKYSPYPPSDPEDTLPILGPLHHSKSTFGLTRSEDSNRTLNRSNPTLPKSNSISTLAPSTSCTGHSRSHSSPPPKETTLPRVSPPTSRRPSTHAANHSPETPSQTQTVNAVTPPLSGSHMLRHTSRPSVAQVTSDAILPDNASYPDCPRDPPEVRPYVSWKPGHRGTSTHLDVRKTTLAWENAHGRHVSQSGVGPEPFTSTHDEGESIREIDRDGPVYAYGYGASGPAYPYLDAYNPQRPGGHAESPSSCEDPHARGLSQGYRGAMPSGPAFSEFSESRSSLSLEEEDSSEEEEEYVAMMGGFVRRMATIESLGSKEGAGTLSTTGSVALCSMRPKTPVSQFSSVYFADGSTGASLRGPASRDGSHSTQYLSFSSGGTGMWVNERGELLLPNASKTTAGSPHERRYYTASGNSFPRTDD